MSRLTAVETWFLQVYAFESAHPTGRYLEDINTYSLFPLLHYVSMKPTKQRTECPNDCSGNGKCLSMRQLALLATDADLVPSPVVYGSTAGNISTWDADSVFGCHCDWMVRNW